MLKTWRVATVVAAVAAGSGVIAGSAAAWADPEPPPAPELPNVVLFTPVSPVDYTVMNGNGYAFAGPAGITCVINKLSVSYGCSGPLPGVPEGTNLVSGGEMGPPAFSSTDRPLSVQPGNVKSLPPNTRLSFRDISCGVDGAGVVACVNTRDQVGFMVGPAGTFIDDVMPLVARPDGNGPMLPGFPR